MFFNKASGLRYVNRGDIGVEDFTLADLTADGAWHNLDLSSIVPVNALMVKLQLYVKAAAVGVQMRIAPAGYTLLYTYQPCKTVVSTDTVRLFVDMPLLEPATIQYWLEDYAWTEAEIDVVGWFI